MVSLIIIIVIFCWIIFSGFFFFHKTSIEFINKKDLFDIVNDSRFFLSLTAIDLYARKSINQNDYKNIYISSYLSFTKSEKNQLSNITRKIDDISDKYNTLKNIPFKFVKLSPDIENGYPHTLNSVIVLNENFFNNSFDKQIETLIHEKIHVYQRLYSLKCQDLICNIWNYIPANLIKNYSLARSNPDLNNVVYMKNDIITIQLYNGNKPLSIADSKCAHIDKNNNISYTNIYPSYISQNEHPYEIMGCLIPKIILGKIDINDDFLENTRKWMDINL